MTSEPKLAYFPVWKDGKGNRFLINAEEFAWPTKEKAEWAQSIVSHKALGADVEPDGIETFVADGSGGFFIHHVDAKAGLLTFQFIAGPELDKRCKCARH